MRETGGALETEVVIIGNGPSGLTLSYMLGGRLPHYRGGGHPEPMLSARLRSLPPGCCLLGADLAALGDGLEGRSGNPSSVLVDKLLRPGEDQGMPWGSLLDWRPAPPVPHVVIGKGPPGGAWQSMEGNILTLSLSSWMELPGLTFAEWERSQKKCDGEESPPRRVRAQAVARYYTDYLHRNRLLKYQKRGMVTSVRYCKQGEWSRDGEGWRVEGVDAGGRGFAYLCRSVVVACGTGDVATRLGVPGEGLPAVTHHLSTLEARLHPLPPPRPPPDYSNFDHSADVLIVGGGLSAADAVLSARFRGLSVVQAFRNSPSALGRVLPESMYPEYHKVYQMMVSGGEGYPGYTSLQGYSVVEFGGEGLALLRSPEGKPTVVRFRLAGVFIGSKPDLGFLPQEYRGGSALAANPGLPLDCRSNPVEVDPGSYRALGAGGRPLFVLGPLAGDNFVRFIIGGCVACASAIIRGAPG